MNLDVIGETLPMRYLPWLLRIAQTVNLRYLKVGAALSLLLMWGAGAALGGYTLGWKGAVLLPLSMIAVTAVSLHLMIVLMLALGLRAHRRGRHRVAAGFLWIAELPRLRRYDRAGKAAEAFRECRALVASQMLQNLFLR